jgi:hypothetical protein
VDIQSISTDRTLAPSLASKAAKGLPTTSELVISLAHTGGHTG